MRAAMNETMSRIIMIIVFGATATFSVGAAFYGHSQKPVVAIVPMTVAEFNARNWVRPPPPMDDETRAQLRRALESQKSAREALLAAQARR